MAIKRGDAAKESVRNTIISAFGNNYITTQDKKIFVQAKDGSNNEMIQIAITLTMPKNTIVVAPKLSEEEEENPAVMEDVTLTEADKNKVNELMDKLRTEGYLD